MESQGGPTVSSEELALQGGTTAAQVRKDLSHFGSFGKRGLGYGVTELADRLRDILGLKVRWRVLLVGAGRIGAALFEYPYFAERGYDCVGVLDNDPDKIGVSWGQVRIRPVEELELVVESMKVDIVILAVPAAAAQALAERAVSAGARAILNFAAVRLRMPAHVHVTNVNLVVELEALSFAITQHGKGKGGTT